MFTDKHKAQMIILTAFLCGVVVGAAGQYIFRQKTLSQPAASSVETLDDMTHAVKLTPAQRKDVERILDDARQQYQALRDRTRPQYNEVRDATRQRIRAMLPLDQQSLYDEWTREQDTKRARKEKSSSAHGGK